MAQLVVRNLDEAVKDGLRRRALRHGRSMEAEAREILGAAVAAGEPPPRRLGVWFTELFSGVGLSETEAIAELQGESARPARFED